MKKNYHFAEHIYKLLIAILFSFVLSFYLTLLIGTYSVLFCTIVSTQITLGSLVYLYLHWGYNISVKSRSNISEFFVGMLPAQAIHFLLYIILYFLFVTVCNYRIFESLPIHRVAVNTPVLGFSFALTGTKVLNLTEHMDENAEIILPENLFHIFLLIFLLFALLCFAICWVCYRRGVFLNERERNEMILGIRRTKKGSFAKRFCFFPIVNIFPLFQYIHRHFFLVEYKISDAIFPLVIIAGIKLLFDFLISVILFYIPMAWMYFLSNFIALYIWGLIISFIVLREEKARGEF